jgi:hypothetical protein
MKSTLNLSLIFHLILALCIGVPTSFVYSKEHPHILPDNDMRIPDMRAKNPGLVTESEFNQVISILKKIYSADIETKSGLKFIVNANWEDDTVNAYATREVESWSIHIAGGLARAKAMTKDSLALIVCHEIGHHLGGAPRTFLFDGWPSAEGQADYWATSKCLKRYYQELRNEEVVLDDRIPEKVMNDCRMVYKSMAEFKICLRSQLAAVDFSNFLNMLPTTKVATSINLLDTREVKGTNTNDYPRPQCRVDTVYAGTLCTIHHSVQTSDTDDKIGHCIDQTKPGTRPKCWYKH